MTEVCSTFFFPDIGVLWFVVLGNFVSALNKFIADRYASNHSVSEYHVYEFFKVFVDVAFSTIYFIGIEVRIFVHPYICFFSLSVYFIPAKMTRSSSFSMFNLMAVS